MDAANPLAGPRSRAVRVVVLVLSTLAILAPAIINGYPYVYSDTGTYIRSAFEGYVPIDRPYWYGLFLRAASMDGTTLWGVIIAQAALCAVYMMRAGSAVLPPRRAGWATLVVSVTLTVCTGLGWYAGQLLPDVFTGIGLLAVFLLLRSGSATWLRVLDGLIIIGACWMHLSNLLILPLAGAFLLFADRHGGRALMRQRLVRLSAVMVLAWGGLALANRAITGEAHISRAGHVFLMGRMLEMGMLRSFLEEHCPTEEFAICTYKDSLPPHSEAFLWWGSSPVAKQGGWAATNEEYDRIIRGSFVEPRYLWWHMRGSLASTGEQLSVWEVCRGLTSGWYRTPDSPPYTMIAKHMEHELPAYTGSLQNGGRGELDMRWPDRAYKAALALSLIIAAGSMIRGKRDVTRRAARQLLFFALAGIVIGAWVCATLSVVDSRYLARDSWLLPFAALLYLASTSRLLGDPAAPLERE